MGRVSHLKYSDFELKIERRPDGYTARVLRSPMGEASTTFTMPLSEDRLELLVIKLSHARRSTRRIVAEETDAARELGGKLFEAIFAGDVRSALRGSLDEAARQDDMGLRLKLRLQDTPELADLPWEFLFDSSLERFFAQSNQTPVVRYLELPERIKPVAVQLPLRVLVMISSPRDPDYPALDVAREEVMLRDSLGPLIRAGQLKFDRLEDATLATLQRRLRSGEYHVFHFIGHGGFDKKAEEGVLILENEHGAASRVGAHRLATLLHDHRSLRLAVLNACEGARNSRQDPFAGVATTLIRQGIPAVVAMQFEITDEAAITFATEFYAALADGYPVDAAVAEARKAIYAHPNDVEWGTPVLYSRAPDGVLFDLQRDPQRSAPVDVPVEVRQPVPTRPMTAPTPPATAPALRTALPAQVPPPPPVASGFQPPQSARDVGDLAMSMLDVALVSQGHTVQVQTDPATFRQRLMAWAAAHGFECKQEAPGSWKFERGSRLKTFYSFNLDKRFVQVTVQIDSRVPAEVDIQCRTHTRGVLFARKERDFMGAQINELIAHLQGTKA
jgi:hypothetical protein